MQSDWATIVVGQYMTMFTDFCGEDDQEIKKNKKTKQKRPSQKGAV